MFAVKGWSVDAQALKPQIEPPKPPKPSKKGTGANHEPVQTKKRKRDVEPTIASNADVGKLWNQHIEGITPSKSAKKGKKEKKRAKLDNATTEVNSTEVVSAASLSTEAGSHKIEQPKESGKEKKPKKQRDAQKTAPTNVKTDGASQSATKPHPLDAKLAKLTPMQAAMRQKLISARFRHLNETLYTEPSVKAYELFDQNPDMFEDYHAGFRQQVVGWPENPLDTFISTIRARGKVRLTSQKNAFKSKKRGNEAEEAESTERGVQALPRTQGTAIIADLGCGDARLARTLKEANELQNLHLRVLSYDLHSPSQLVTKADIANLPAEDGSVDVAIFCLALMGTNWISFIEEAHRILHWKGELWIAEIKSRFGRVGRAGRVVEHSVGGKRKQAAIKKAQEAKKREQEEVNEQDALAVEVDGVETKNEETDVSAFVEVLKRRGFVLKNGDSSIDLNNKMFVKMEFLKAAAPTKGKGVGADAKTPPPRFKNKKFLEEDKDDVATDDEAKVLKPCLYKIR